MVEPPKRHKDMKKPLSEDGAQVFITVWFTKGRCRGASQIFLSSASKGMLFIMRSPGNFQDLGFSANILCPDTTVHFPEFTVQVQVLMAHSECRWKPWMSIVIAGFWHHSSTATGNYMYLFFISLHQICLWCPDDRLNYNCFSQHSSLLSKKPLWCNLYLIKSFSTASDTSDNLCTWQTSLIKPIFFK